MATATPSRPFRKRHCPFGEEEPMSPSFCPSPSTVSALLSSFASSSSSSSASAHSSFNSHSIISPSLFASAIKRARLRFEYSRPADETSASSNYLNAFPSLPQPALDDLIYRHCPRKRTQIFMREKQLKQQQQQSQQMQQQSTFAQSYPSHGFSSVPSFFPVAAAAAPSSSPSLFASPPSTSIPVFPSSVPPSAASTSFLPPVGSVSVPAGFPVNGTTANGVVIGHQDGTGSNPASLMFSYEEVKELLASALKEQEELIRADYDVALQQKLSEQFESFSRFNQDWLSRQAKQTEFSYLS